MLFYLLLISYCLIAVSLYLMTISHRGIVFDSWSDWAFETLMILLFPLVIVLFVLWILINFIYSAFNIIVDLIRSIADKYFKKKDR